MSNESKALFIVVIEDRIVFKADDLNVAMSFRDESGAGAVFLLVIPNLLPWGCPKGKRMKKTA